MNLHRQTILLVEDNDDDAELTVLAFNRIIEDSDDDTSIAIRELKRAGYDVDFRRVDSSGPEREPLQAGVEPCGL